MKSKELHLATSVMANSCDLLDMLIDGKLANMVIDLGSHEMYMETREKPTPKVTKKVTKKKTTREKKK